MPQQSHMCCHIPSLQAEKDGPKALDEFCKDLCAEVRAGRIDPVIGRESEVCRRAACSM